MIVKFHFLHAFTLLFVGLKLTNYVDWSWWYVLAPTWVPATIVYSLSALGLLCMGAAWLMMSKEERARHKAAKACRALADAYAGRE